MNGPEEHHKHSRRRGGPDKAALYRKKLGPLPKASIRVRKNGAEHDNAVGLLFDYPQINVYDLYRTGRLTKSMNNRCARCAVEDGMGVGRSTGRLPPENKSKGACVECEKAKMEEKLRLKREQEVERMEQLEWEERIKARRAKERRENFSNMFRPNILTPLSQSNSALIVDDDSYYSSEEDEDEAEDSKEEKMIHPPPRQLESLLPIAISSKKEFLSTIKDFRHQRQTLDAIRIKAKQDLKEKLERERREREEAAAHARYEELIGMCLGRLRNRTMAKCFLTWSDNVRQVKKLRMMSMMSLEKKRLITFRVWRQYIKDWKIEKACAAVVIQAFGRVILAKKRTNLRRRKIAAAKTIQGFGRCILAKSVLRLAKQKIFQQEDLVKKSLLRLCGNRKMQIFIAWKRHTKVLKNVQSLAKRSGQHLLDHCMRRWKSNAALQRRRRIADSILMMQKIGRGFVARLRFRTMKSQQQASIVIQNFVRVYFARMTLRNKLRQRRVVKRKLARSLASTKKSRFLEWKVYTRQVKMLRKMMNGSRIRVLDYFFDKWSFRRFCAIEVQRCFRGYLGRILAKQNKQRYLEEMARNGCSNMGEKERLNLLLDEQYSSSLLTKLRSELLKVRRLKLLHQKRQEAMERKLQRQPTKKENKQFLWDLQRAKASGDGDDDEHKIGSPNFAQSTKAINDPNSPFYGFTLQELNHPDEIELKIHDTWQQFVISKHGQFLIDIISREIEKEILRLQGESKEMQAILQAEHEEWKRIVQDYLGKGTYVNVDQYRSYHNSGKSFMLKIETPEQALETIRSWKQMHREQFITRETILVWILEGLLFQRSIRINQRLIIWKALKQEFDRSFMEDLAGLVMKRMKK